MRVLLVEDHADTAEAIAHLLEKSGHAVTAVATGHDAEQLCESCPFDVMICDIMLPDCEGWDLAGVCGKHGVPAIAFTAMGTESDIARSSSAGFVAHVVKPVEFEQLKEALRRIPTRSR